MSKRFCRLCSFSFTRIRKLKCNDKRYIREKRLVEYTNQIPGHSPALLVREKHQRSLKSTCKQAKRIQGCTLSLSVTVHNRFT